MNTYYVARVGSDGRRDGRRSTALHSFFFCFSFLVEIVECVITILPNLLSQFTQFPSKAHFEYVWKMVNVSSQYSQIYCPNFLKFPPRHILNMSGKSEPASPILQASPASLAKRLVDTPIFQLWSHILISEIWECWASKWHHDGSFWHCQKKSNQSLFPLEFCPKSRKHEPARPVKDISFSG